MTFRRIVIATAAITLMSWGLLLAGAGRRWGWW
jgi:hypothetical protein